MKFNNIIVIAVEPYIFYRDDKRPLKYGCFFMRPYQYNDQATVEKSYKVLLSPTPGHKYTFLDQCYEVEKLLKHPYKEFSHFSEYHIAQKFCKIQNYRLSLLYDLLESKGSKKLSYIDDDGKNHTFYYDKHSGFLIKINNVVKNTHISFNEMLVILFNIKTTYKLEIKTLSIIKIVYYYIKSLITI